jgi:signal transduction histidine kinase
VTERRFATDLVSRFSRVTWITLASYALVVIVVFASVSEISLGRSLAQTATVIESLLGLYADPGGERTTVAPDMLADQLVGMGARFVITRTASSAEEGSSVYFLSSTMPAQRIETLGPTATADEVQAEIARAVAARGRWRNKLHHQRSGEFDIFVAGSRQTSLFAVVGLAAAALTLLPLAALTSRRATKSAVSRALEPVERVRTETQAIGPQDLSRRVGEPTGVSEITQIANSINRLVERVETAHRALEAFTADASHELRTPLTYMKAQAQWALAEHRTAEEMREALAAIGGEVERTNKLAEDLLLLARGDNRVLAVNRERFDVQGVARETVEITEAMATGREIVVQHQIPGPVYAIGDSDHTRRVMLNLAANAVRHTGRGTVTISARREHDTIDIAIADTGEGIPAPDLPHIFAVSPLRGCWPSCKAARATSRARSTEEVHSLCTSPPAISAPTTIPLSRPYGSSTHLGDQQKPKRLLECCRCRAGHHLPIVQHRPWNVFSLHSIMHAWPHCSMTAITTR